MHLVLDKLTKRSKGLAYILYMIPECAVRLLLVPFRFSFKGFCYSFSSSRVSVISFRYVKFSSISTSRVCLFFQNSSLVSLFHACLIDICYSLASAFRLNHIHYVQVE